MRFQLKFSFEVMSPTEYHLESMEKFLFQNRKVIKSIAIREHRVSEWVSLYLQYNNKNLNK